jgi:glycosyltransferase involved in cell wall biosynthesis
MIVKNESHVIHNTLKNICEKIPISYWIICDTGSTDKTKKIIKSFFKEKKIPGKLINHTWKDFAHNRTKALARAYNKTDYLFIFDADDSIVGNIVLPELTHDKYMLSFGNDVLYERPLLITNRKKWKFIGVLHEYLDADEPRTSANIKGDYYIISGRTGARNQNPNKYYDDI